MAQMTRRNFVAGTAAAGIALGAVANGTALADDANGTYEADELPWLGEEPQIDDSQVEEEVECDVIVVGCGLAGVNAVRAAAEEGVKVVAFEKADSPQGRSGQYAVVNGSLMARWGRDGMDPDMIVDHEMDECSYFPKRAIWSRWAKEGADAFDWFIAAMPDLPIYDEDVNTDDECYLAPFFLPMPENYDWTIETHPCIPISLGIRPTHVPLIVANMEKAITENDVTAYYGHFAEKLIQDESGRVIGVYARNAETGGYVKAIAAKGVVLACGEYANNKEILSFYAPDVVKNNIMELWSNFDVEGNPTNTGDGLKMGAWIGAAIQQHHAPMIHHMGTHPDGGNSPMGINPFLRLNREGKRFMNEDCPGQQTENQIENCSNHRAYMIWDAKWSDQLQWFPAAHGVNLNVTPEAVESAVESGMVLKADTIEELLDFIDDIDKDVAKASIERYNALAEAGKDEDFGKDPRRLFAVDTPPFYCSPLAPSPMLVCIGGLESDEECHVYSTKREIIPGIYVAGNIQGNRYAVQYPIALKGVSHSLAQFYGYVAGKNAAAGI